MPEEPFDGLSGLFAELCSGTEFCALRAVRQDTETLSVRRDVTQPPRRSVDGGAMLSVIEAGGVGYAATPDLSRNGLTQALAEAKRWARLSARHALVDLSGFRPSTERGRYRTAVQRPWSGLALSAKLDLLHAASRALRRDDRIVHWQASLQYLCEHALYLNSAGAHCVQRTELLLPGLAATAQHQGESQTRTFGSHAHLRQGGLEILDQTGFTGAAVQVGEQALELLAAPNCPSDTMDVVLAPDQMILQIHESIGHPLELDRILGDERNYAGTSFVTPAMFGSYRYGSQHLNVTHDPGVAGEAVSAAYDDDGNPARREHLIRDGVLQRPLGGALSQFRANLPGVANSRASNWNRPSIDRMANLNLEPGNDTLEGLIGQVERGVYLQTNRSWSIDDSRNKFQFGCEYGHMIENGRLTGVVKNPNYRGVSATFWRSLAGVGDAASVELLGTLYCGKGEPNQAVSVGHAAPPCLFRDVAVFGGE